MTCKRALKLPFCKHFYNDNSARCKTTRTNSDFDILPSLQAVFTRRPAFLGVVAFATHCRLHLGVARAVVASRTGRTVRNCLALFISAERPTVNAATLCYNVLSHMWAMHDKNL